MTALERGRFRRSIPRQAHRADSSASATIRDDATSVPAPGGRGDRVHRVPPRRRQNRTPVGVLMTDTYGPATAFQSPGMAHVALRQRSRDRRRASSLIFSNVSFVGPDSLATRLKDAGTVQTADGSPSPTTDGVFRLAGRPQLPERQQRSGALLPAGARGDGADAELHVRSRGYLAGAGLPRWAQRAHQGRVHTADAPGRGRSSTCPEPRARPRRPTPEFLHRRRAPVLQVRSGAPRSAPTAPSSDRLLLDGRPPRLQLFE